MVFIGHTNRIVTMGDCAWCGMSGGIHWLGVQQFGLSGVLRKILKVAKLP